MAKKTKQKRAKKAMGVQVARPSFKKPRPKKHVEPKVPQLVSILAPVDMKPEVVDAPQPVIDVQRDPAGNITGISGELNEATMKAAIEELAKTAQPTDMGTIYNDTAAITSGATITLAELTAKPIDGVVKALNERLAADPEIEARAKRIKGMAQILQDDGTSKPIKTGGVSTRPKLKDLRDSYEEYRAGGIKGPNPPRPKLPGPTIQVELPYGHTEKSIAKLLMGVVRKLEIERQQKTNEVADLYGSKYQSKGFKRMEPEEKAKFAETQHSVDQEATETMKRFDAEELRKTGSTAPAYVPEMKKLTWLERVKKWFE